MNTSSMENCLRSLDEFTDDQGEDFLLELTRQMSYSTVENIIKGFNPPSATTTKTFNHHHHHHHHLVSFDQSNISFNYKGRRGRINQTTKAINPKQQMKQRQQRQQEAAAWGDKMNRPGLTKEVINGSEVGAPQPHRHMQGQQQGTYGIRRESAGTGVFLPRHQPEDTSRKTDVDTNVVGRGQSNTSTTTTTTAYALLSHHRHHQPKKFQNLNDEKSRSNHHHHHQDSVIRLPEE